MTDLVHRKEYIGAETFEFGVQVTAQAEQYVAVVVR